MRHCFPLCGVGKINASPLITLDDASRLRWISALFVVAPFINKISLGACCPLSKILFRNGIYRVWELTDGKAWRWSEQPSLLLGRDAWIWANNWRHDRQHVLSWALNKQLPGKGPAGTQSRGQAETWIPLNQPRPGSNRVSWKLLLLGLSHYLDKYDAQSHTRSIVFPNSQFHMKN